MLAFRPWWRTLTLLVLLALLPLAWRGTGRETPILIQHVSSDPTHVPPPVAMLSVADPGPPGTLRSARGLLVAGAAQAADAAAEGSAVEEPLPEAPLPAGPLPEERPLAGRLGEDEAPTRPCPNDAPDPQHRSDQPARGRINLNTADAALLQTLPGIGPALAQRILEYRERWGPFTHPRQLLEVSGIGEKRLEQLLPWVTVE